MGKRNPARKAYAGFLQMFGRAGRRGKRLPVGARQAVFLRVYWIEWQEIKTKEAELQDLARQALRDVEKADWFTLWQKACELRKMVEAMPLYSEYEPLQDFALHIAQVEHFAGGACGQG